MFAANGATILFSKQGITISHARSELVRRHREVKRILRTSSIEAGFCSNADRVVATP